MRHLQTEVLVIGGGATGTGILRDLALRGFKCILVERRDLASGTTGRYHGLLHSGGRYVVKDPKAAQECYQENQILRRIMPACIEDTGGFFVQTPYDDPGYITPFLDGCKRAGIPVEEVTTNRMLKEEPALSRSIQRCFRVPDASADSFLAARLNIESASEHGAQVLTYHEVVSLILDTPAQAGHAFVRGLICHDLVKDEDVQIDASILVNASGAWAGKIAAMAGINMIMVPGKGTMLALNYRIVSTVINRCKLPADGDILVPAHTVVVIGTTDIRVTDPDHYAIEPWEIQLMQDEGEKLIPQFKQFRLLRAWAGVRPLVKGIDQETDRDISRAYVLLDHAERDGVDGLVTITGGKWTTYRKMAEVTVDKVCEKLGTQRRCKTHLEVLPDKGSTKAHSHYLGVRLEKIEQNHVYGQLVCECELATLADIEQAILQGGACTMDDIRRKTRLGMGPCQGAFCTVRAAGFLHSLKHPHVVETNVSIRDFLQERWKGDLSILSGQQLHQVRFNELLHVDILNIPHLPGEQKSGLATDDYSQPESEQPDARKAVRQREKRLNTTSQSHYQDIIIIGAGIAGLFTAWQAITRGRKPKVITRGWGTPYWSTGCIDIFGYQPPVHLQRIVSPRSYLAEFVNSNPDHPYALAGLATVENAVQSFLTLSREHGYPYHGSLDSNIMLPTALGALRPTCLVPDTMIAGDTFEKPPMLIVGFDGFLDFFPSLIADNLNAQGILARELSINLPSLHKRKLVTAMTLARLFDHPDFVQEVIDALKPRLSRDGRIGFPAVLGLRHPLQVKEHLESELGVPVFEIPGLPPSIPGIRLQELLVAEIEANGGSILNGMEVIGARMDSHHVSGVISQAAARQVSHTARTIVLATGGILGGGISSDKSGYAQETIFDLPLAGLDPGNPILQSKYLDSRGHQLFKSGALVNQAFQPIDASGDVIIDNLWAVGNALAHCDPLREFSLEGIALASGAKVAEILSRGELV